MSDENKTENPYQPPALSDETLVKKDADAPKARLHPVHWLLPILGYVFVPPFFILDLLGSSYWSQGQFGIAEQLQNYRNWLGILSIFVLPVYVVGVLLLGWQRHRKGTNTLGIKLYHGLSLILPILWFFCLILLVKSGHLTLK